MEINLSEETIKTVRTALRSQKNNLEAMLRKVEVGRASMDRKEFFEQELEATEDALAVFEELEV